MSARLFPSACVSPFVSPSASCAASGLSGAARRVRVRAGSPSGARAAACLSPAAAPPAAAARRMRGQGMTEYIIVVALIAVAAIGVYTLFGQTIRNQTAGLALEVSGQTASTAISAAQTNAGTASTNADVRKGLDNYDADNH